MFEEGPGFGGTTEGDEGFAELDVDGHPIRFVSAERAEMLDGLGVIIRVEVRLGEVEAGQIVTGESLPKFEGLGDSVVAHRGGSS